MPNPGGANQFGGVSVQPKYGDVKRETQLTRESPMSGSPIAAQALNTPRRSQKRAVRGNQQPVMQAPAPEAAQMDPSVTYQQIASIPGASPLVQEIFGGS